MPKTIKTLSTWSFIAFFLCLVFYFFFFAYSCSTIRIPTVLWICAFLISPFILLMLGISLHHLAKTAGTANYLHTTTVTELTKKMDALQAELDALRKETSTQ